MEGAIAVRRALWCAPPSSSPPTRWWDACCKRPKPGQHRKGREAITVNGIFGSFPLVRDYEPTTCVSSFASIEAFGPCLRQEARNDCLALAA